MAQRNLEELVPALRKLIDYLKDAESEAGKTKDALEALGSVRIHSANVPTSESLAEAQKRVRLKIKDELDKGITDYREYVQEIIKLQKAEQDALLSRAGLNSTFSWGGRGRIQGLDIPTDGSQSQLNERKQVESALLASIEREVNAFKEGELEKAKLAEQEESRRAVARKEAEQAAIASMQREKEAYLANIQEMRANAPYKIGEFASGVFGGDFNADSAQANIGQAVSALGFSMKDLSPAVADANGKFVVFNAEVKDAYGHTKRATFALDAMENVTVRTGSAFQSFGAQLSSSIQNFVKWGIAAMLVYQPLNAIQEQIGILVQNQVELANISVVVGNEQEKMARVFDAVADAAEISAESISGVIEGYSQALRATGNIEDQYTRTATANQLLTDSLVLSKLSTFDQAQAMDTLVAALRQIGPDLNNGQQLLDQWVATTKIANVDLRTLAESYAIVGSVAQSAGLEIAGTNNELVGLIAVLAEQTQLTPTETGNALRAVLTGIGAGEAERNLSQYGIAVKGVNGEMREFLDIAGEISDKFRAGLISESELTSISKAIGGGTRRQAQVEILLRGLNRAQEINSLVSSAQGDAYEALEIRVDNLSDSLTNLGNALQELLQTWGSDGGLLQIAQLFADILSKVIRLVDQLSSSAGSGILPLLLTGGLGLYGKLGQTNLLAKQVSMGGKALGGLTVGGLAASGGAAFAAGVNYFGNDDPQAAGANIAGAIAGGLISQGSPIGIALGSAIAEAFVNGTRISVDDLGNYLAEAYIASKERQEAEAFGGTPTETNKPVLTQEDYDKLVEEMTTFPGLTKLAINAGAFLSPINKAFGGEEYSTEDRILQLAQQYAPDLLNEMLTKYAQQFNASEAGAKYLSYGTNQRTFQGMYGGQVAGLQGQLTQETIDLILQGEVPQKEISGRLGTIKGLDSFLADIYATNQVTGGAGISIDSQSMKDAADVFINATEDQRNTINQVTGQIREYSNALDVAANQGLSSGDMLEEFGMTVGETRTSMVNLANAQEEYINKLSKLQAFEAFKEIEPTRIGTGTGQFSSYIVQQIARVASFRQQEYLDTFPSDDIRDAWLDTIKDVLFEFENGTIKAYGELEGLAPEFVRKAIEELKDVGVIGTGNIQNPGFLNVPFGSGSAIGQSILGGSAYQSLLSNLTQLGYIEQLEDTIVVYENKKLEARKLDSTIVQMLLGQIEENTSDMVDGIYNLPTDGTFFVPWTGAAASQGGAGVNYSDILALMYEAMGGPTIDRTGGRDYDKRIQRPEGLTKTRRTGSGITFGWSPEQLEAGQPSNSYTDTIRIPGMPPQTITSEGPTSSIVEPIANALSSLSESINTEPIAINIQISSFFETYLDGEKIAETSKRAVLDEMVRKSDSSGISISSTI